jgi:hypothetical protein
MQPPKRQIIKTRPQQPYIVARIILLIIVVAALAAAAWFFLRPHPAHALAPVTVEVVLAGEDAPFAERIAQVQLSVERGRS